MKIVHVITNDLEGGAARAAYRLHGGLLKLGHESLMFVAHKASDDPTVIQFSPSCDLASRAARFLPRRQIKRDFAKYAVTRPEGFELFSDDRNSFGRQSVIQLPEADIVNLHWISGFIDYRAFFSSLPERIRIVWTLHDMNPFTGGCHYDMGCAKYLEGCGACPQLGSEHLNDLSRQIWQRKYSLFSSLDPASLHLIALNQWMAKEVHNSPLLSRFPVSVIPNGLDASVFKPRNKKTAREFFEIKPDAKVVLFVAHSTNIKRKGLDMLMQALSELRDLPSLTLLSVGRNKPQVDFGMEHLHLGLIDNDLVLSQIYNAADVFVIPSFQDNLPNTLMEAMACGTPSVGFDAGGIPDLIRPGKTGFLIKNFDIEAMRNAIRELLIKTELRVSMSQQCRDSALNAFTQEYQAGNYSKLYESILMPLRTTDA
ncbi:glycosyltransferase family 4 protein [Methylosarcina fibrata]|uniref:glycosyltransferase family 4 protein n=1 Tax=Methylosarcina fibrata TaxID=105972 RepID=UPI0003708D75|nr:glycosyltransferase family 4 protein [Methylosarcina fibrata]